jgi:hypothetical protein
VHENHTPPLTRPGALAGITLNDPLTGYEEHVASLVRARLGVGEPEPLGRLRADALDALVCGQALADRLTAMRWVTVAEALADGAPIAHVGAALGLEIDEVAAGPRSWADGQHLHAGMSPAARNEVHALLGRALGSHPHGEVDR